MSHVGIALVSQMGGREPPYLRPVSFYPDDKIVEIVGAEMAVIFLVGACSGMSGCSIDLSVRYASLVKLGADRMPQGVRTAKADPRERAMFLLQSIKGVSPKRAHLLLEAFGSAASVANASLDALMAVKVSDEPLPPGSWQPSGLKLDSAPQIGHSIQNGRTDFASMDFILSSLEDRRNFDLAFNR